ncbi:hypothetical protein PIB30_085857, partial [Stylosanthes scabra]|nr:hypothetical protein [Stylosanthes scabra]
GTREAPAPLVHEPPQASMAAQGMPSKRVERHSPPPSAPPKHSETEGPSQETLARASAATQKKFRFMQTPGLHKQL